ncbi:MAG TPA: DNA-3-methyladenine glycosylase I [Rhodospirillaceae bacterium]|nr:DNA-3-methyladenine glycosylase I [Rhodospirillaceae bacterium]
MNWYCDIAPGHPFHGPYHENEYGFPVREDRVLFERLSLEIFQAGLSWLIVLKKRPALNLAFDSFDPLKVADYGEAEVARLMADASIIRNQRKIRAIIENAKRFNGLAAENGSVARWLQGQHPKVLEDWVKLFRQSFVFTGGEVVNEFLMSCGLLPGAHHPDCPVAAKLAKLG